MLCVGYTYEQVEEFYENCLDENGDYKYENIYEFCEGEGLTSYSPYYDADKEHCIYGEEVASSDDYSYEEVTGSIDSKVQVASQTLQEQWKVRPKVYIMANGW